MRVDDDGRAVLRDRPAPATGSGTRRAVPDRPILRERPGAGGRGLDGVYDRPHDGGVRGPRSGDSPIPIGTPAGRGDGSTRDGRGHDGGHVDRPHHGRGHGGHGHHGYCPYHRPYRPDVVGPGPYILGRYIHGLDYYGIAYHPYHYLPLGLYFGFHSYYPYDRYYGYYGAPAPVVVETDVDPYAVEVGALDLNVKPKDVEVYLNGYPIGTADDFDGYPSLLWLEEGEYELIFFKEGYETVLRSFYVRAGHEINVRFTLQPGESVLPETLSSRYLEPVTEGEVSPALLAAAIGEEPVTEDGDAPLDARDAPALLRVTVEPATASIYLDGRLIATGELLAGRRGVIFVDAGEHVIEVVHPGYEQRELRFTVEPGEELELAVPPLEARVADVSS